MLESLTWQATFAIVGSVVVIVTGIFGYLIKTRNGAAPAPNKNAVQNAVQDAIEQQKEFSEVRERMVALESDIKILMQHGKNSNRRLDEHIEQDNKNFNQLNAKMDKLTDILIKVIRDEKL